MRKFFKILLLGFGSIILLNYSNMFAPIINKIRYSIKCNKAEKSLWKNSEANTENLFLLDNIFKDDLGSFSLFFRDDLIKIENLEQDKVQSNYFNNQQKEQLFLLEDIIGNSRHWIFEKNKNIKVKFEGRTDIEFLKEILQKFDNQSEKFLEVLGLLKLTDCHKLIKKSDCLRLIHRSISKTDLNAERLDSGSSLTKFSYLLGECYTYDEDIENQNKGGLTITMSK